MTKQPWLIDSAKQKGITGTTINYLTGKTKRLNPITLTWSEFFLLHSLLGKTFEKKAIYKRFMDPFVNMKNNLTGIMNINYIEDALKEVPGMKSFFLKRLPIFAATMLCNEFYEASNLWPRCTNKVERRIILDRIKVIASITAFDKEKLSKYWALTADSPVDREIVVILIGDFIYRDVDNAYYLARENKLTEAQLKCLCVQLEKAKNSVGVEDLLELYIKTNNADVLALLLNKLKNYEHKMYLFERLQGHRRDTKESERETLLLQFLPIVHYLLVEKNFFKEFTSRKEVRDFLPKYFEDNRIEEILDKVTEFYSHYEYKMTLDTFETWYTYKAKAVFVDLFIQSISAYNYQPFTSAIKVFCMCKDEVVIDAVIRIGLPKLEQATDDLAFFLDWLKPQNNSWYHQVKDEFVKNNYLEKWVCKLNGPEDRNMKDFIKIASHFI